MATENYQGQDPVNLGANSEITINDLAQKIRTMIGYEGVIIWDGSKPDGQPRRCLDTTRAKELFDFKAKTPLSLGLKQTIDWFISNKPREF
jgi:GDP-L-fucose synthase